MVAIFRIAVSHRLKTILDCDRIAALNDGKLQEVGKPEDLLNQPDSNLRSMAQDAGLLWLIFDIFEVKFNFSCHHFDNLIIIYFLFFFCRHCAQRRYVVVSTQY